MYRRETSSYCSTCSRVLFSFRAILSVRFTDLGIASLRWHQNHHGSRSSPSLIGLIGFPPVATLESCAWHLLCSKPKDHDIPQSMCLQEKEKKYGASRTVRANKRVLKGSSMMVRLCLSFPMQRPPFALGGLAPMSTIRIPGSMQYALTRRLRKRKEYTTL